MLRNYVERAGPINGLSSRVFALADRLESAPTLWEAFYTAWGDCYDVFNDGMDPSTSKQINAAFTAFLASHGQRPEQPPAQGDKDAQIAELENNIITLTALVDPSICRLQFPDGTVPGNAKEAAEGWYRVANERGASIVVLEREVSESREKMAAAHRLMDRAMATHPDGTHPQLNGRIMMLVKMRDDAVADKEILESTTTTNEKLLLEKDARVTELEREVEDRRLAMCEIVRHLGRGQSGISTQELPGEVVKIVAELSRLRPLEEAATEWRKWNLHYGLHPDPSGTAEFYDEALENLEKIIDALAAPATPAASPRDWPEDAPHEDGKCFLICCECKLGFTGYKRRVACKKCTNKKLVASDSSPPLMNVAGYPTNLEHCHCGAGPTRPEFVVQFCQKCGGISAVAKSPEHLRLLITAASDSRTNEQFIADHYREDGQRPSLPISEQPEGAIEWIDLPELANRLRPLLEPKGQP